MRRFLVFSILFLFLAGVCAAERTGAVWVEESRSGQMKEIVTYYEEGETYVSRLNGSIVVLDAGHGGRDPGKVGRMGTLEKEVNLKLVYVLRRKLEEQGYLVYLTRKTDAGLYEEGDRNRKLADMKKRVEIMEAAKPDLVISIHQNSFPDAAVHGAQCFYYPGAEQAKLLAACMQQAFSKGLTDNRRKEKSNSDYYLLRKTECPVVIVECGFLSCPDEEKLLNTEAYQELLADCMVQGILAYETARHAALGK